ncbi:MAG: SpoIID/LytB domain-containing protein [Clostridia bacterium]|nr:SpoIID/LytB domain-containing protein [Clostridia bacterium]
MYTGKIKRLIALILIFCLMAPSAFADTTALRAAPLSTGGELNGMVRVYLSSLNSPSQLDITVNGSYTVNGDSSKVIPKGTKAVVKFNKSTGKLTLTYNGQTHNMGSSFKLRRHQASGDNGLYIAQTYSSSNLFPGDLSFQVKASDGAYKLFPIVHVFIEDYLMGVVPYEMGNANPLEALKAQTVAARTYTLRAMQNASSRDYDVVDTASDQVYRGTPTGNSNCRKAIEETRGIVSMNGNSLTGTFYTASNGGQIESPRNLWGGSSYPYIVVKDDPYDLANPGSRVKSFTINASGNQGNAVLQQLLDSKAAAMLGSGAKVKGISAVTPHTPKYASPSRLYTKLDFNAFVQHNGEIKAITLSFDIFSELETPLSMSHSSMQNELWTVAETNGGFRVEARRWGHGTGMSQRGAMQMAELGHTYSQILNFYFEGCKLVRYSFTRTILSAVQSGQQSGEEVFVENAAPLEGETDAPPQDPVLAKVTTQSGSLNLRAEGSASAKVMDTIPRNTVIEIHEVLGDWCLTVYKGQLGYVMTSFLTFINTDAPTSTPAPEIPEGTLLAKVTTQSGSLNLRAGSSTSHRVLTTIPREQIIPVYEKGTNWCKTAFGSHEGYVMTSFLTFLEAETATPTPQPESTPTAAPETPDETKVYGKVTTKSGSLNLRENPNSSAKVLTTIPRHQVIPLTEVGTVWCKTSYNGHDGYVMTSFLTINVQEENDPSGLIATAQVTTESGTLNLRSYASTSARVIRTIPRHAYVNVYEMDDDWCSVTYDGSSGYVMTKFLTIEPVTAPTATPASTPTALPTAAPTATPAATPTTTPAPEVEQEEVPAALDHPILGQVNSNADTLFLRSGPAKTYSIIYELPKGDFLMVTHMSENWCKIIYEGREGYCMRQFLILPDEY